MTQKLSKATILQNTIDHIQVISDKKDDDEKQLERLHREVKGMKIMLNELGGMIKKQRQVPAYQSHQRYILIILKKFQKNSEKIQLIPKKILNWFSAPTRSNWRVSRISAPKCSNRSIRKSMSTRLVPCRTICLSGLVSRFSLSFKIF